MASTYPEGIFAPPLLQDDIDFDYAANIMAAYYEIVAIETALGPNVETLHNVAHVDGTVGTILDGFDTAISALQSKTAVTYATLLGGPASGLNISASQSPPLGLNLQALNGATGQPADLYLQSLGGDLLLGGSGGQVTVYGSLSIVGSTSRLIASTLVIDGPASVGQLSALNVSAVSTVSAAVVSAANVSVAENISAHNYYLGQGAIVLDGAFERILAAGTGTSIWDGDQVYSIKKIHGHIRGYSSQAFETTGWSQACFTAIRGDIGSGGTPSDFNSAVWYATYSNYAGGIALCFGSDAKAINLGLQSWNGSMNGNAAFFGTAFIVASSGDLKENIRDMEPPGLLTLARLRPVTFKRKEVSHFSPSMVDEGTQQLVPATGDARREAQGRYEAERSAGDNKRAALESHGLIAEEVEGVLPEAVHYDADGKPAGIDYTTVIALLVKANQELAKQVSALEARVNKLHV